MILVIDNYDSFTYNLVQELETVGSSPVRVVRNDADTAEGLLGLGPSALVVSPGPGTPEEAGVSMALLAAAVELPALGICLGHQALAAVHGARVVRAPEPVHGKVAEVHHRGEGLFASLPSPLEATRYHSLVADRESLPSPLEVTAWSADGLVMALSHRDRPHHGVQFHPESYLTRHGPRLLARFLELAGLPLSAAGRELLDGGGG